MKKYIILRVLKAIVTIWIVWTLVFILTRLTGDPVDWILSDSADDAAREAMRAQLGLDRPLLEQYFTYFFNIFRGDAGTSYFYKRPVLELFGQRVGATVSLGLIVFVVSIFIGIPVGIFSAVHHNTVGDRLMMGAAIVGYTVPNFVMGILLIFLFSLNLRWLPSGGSSDGVLSYIMPVITLAAGPTASIARLTRSSMLDIIRQDYLDSARAKGVRERRVIFIHALRNALVPVVTILGGQLSTLIGGSVVVETVFSWPGIGTLIINGARHRDFPLVQFGVLVIAISVTFINLLVDLSYGWLDPRIRDSY
ncbi:ABC transporter permease [Eubacteriales bacterium OttesenSCG-928-A19]|nr:ABC transporter permease [Eubacteriales bacterium OttesenSCG-928-A19]